MKISLLEPIGVSKEVLDELSKGLIEKGHESTAYDTKTTDVEELKKRLLERNTESKAKILERFKTAYNEINEIKKYNYVVVNDRVDYAVEKVKAIIKAEKCRVDRIEDIYLNTKEEFIHEGLIDKEFVNEDVKI